MKYWVLAVAAFLTLFTHAGEAVVETKFWKEIPEQSDVLTATFIGGSGHEWLVSGGFQPDGTIVVAGNVLGPLLDLPVPVAVIGADQAPPPEAKRIQKTEKGQPKVDGKGQPVFEKPSWTTPGTTGFLVRLSPDAKTLLSAVRLPWQSGAITSAAVGPDGAVYLAGRATDAIASLGPAQAYVPVDSGKKDGRCNHVFLAKLSADGTKAEWVRHAKGFSDAPKVTLLNNGNVKFAAQDLRTYSPAGAAIETAVVPGGANERVSVSPVDGSIVKGGEHHWPTGREPYRCPTLNIHKPDGSLQYQLYDWGGPYVGLDNCRQVSDSAVRAVTHDKDGNILIYAWSDGGNSVMTTEPTDVRQTVAPKGLGITAAGAGVLSAAYLIRIDPKEYRATGWTLWLAFRGVNKPNSIWIDALGLADDGSVVFAGRSAIGLWQTKNKLADGPPAGSYVAVLTPDMSGVRYCSAIPGAGTAIIGNDERQCWGVATGTANGKPRALFLCGATDVEEQYGVTTQTPTRNAAQNAFGGGWSDGYVAIVDLSGGPAAAAPIAIAKSDPRPTRASFEISAAAKNNKRGNDTAPAEGTTFAFKPDAPKFVTVDAEIRDRSGMLWPNFLYGKPVSGTLTYSSLGPTGTITVACSAICQNKGDQSRRVLGELVKDEKPPEFSLRIDSIGTLKTEERSAPDNRGKATTRTVEFAEAKGVLTLAGKSIPVAPRLTFAWPSSKGGALGGVRIDAWMTIKAGELGLTTPGKDTEIDVRVGLQGTPVSASSRQ